MTETAHAIEELEPDEIADDLDAQLVGRIGCHADGATYVVPVIYAFDGGSIYVASLEGRKLQMMRRNPSVCFEVDEYDGAGSWRSVVAQGVYEELSGAGAERALAALADRFRRRDGDGAGGRRAQNRNGSAVCFRIRILEATGRAVRRAPQAS